MTEGREAPATSILFDVFALNQAVGALLDEAMTSGPLTPTEYALLSAIFELEAASPTAIAARTGMRLTTLADRLRPLSDRGFLTRIPNRADGRSYLLALSADGLRAHHEANRQFEVAYQAVVAELGDREPEVAAVLQAARAAADRARRAVLPLTRDRAAPRPPRNRVTAAISRRTRLDGSRDRSHPPG